MGCAYADAQEARAEYDRAERESVNKAQRLLEAQSRLNAAHDTERRLQAEAAAARDEAARVHTELAVATSLAVTRWGWRQEYAARVLHVALHPVCAVVLWSH